MVSYYEGGRFSNIKKKKSGLGAGITKVPTKLPTQAGDVAAMARKAKPASGTTQQNLISMLLGGGGATDLEFGYGPSTTGLPTQAGDIAAMARQAKATGVPPTTGTLPTQAGDVAAMAREAGRQPWDAITETLPTQKGDVAAMKREADRQTKEKVATGTEPDEFTGTPEEQDAVDPTDPTEVTVALDSAAKKVNEPLPPIVQNQENAADLPPVDRFLPSEADIAAMQERAFSGMLTPEDLTRLFESETRITNEIGRLRQESSVAAGQLVMLEAGLEGVFGVEPDLTMARDALMLEGIKSPGPEQIAKKQEEMRTEARGTPESIDKLRSQAALGSLADAYETKRRSLQDLRDRLDDRNKLRRQELPLEAERAQALQGLFRQLFPGAEEGAFDPIGQVGRISLPDIIPMLVQQQRQQQQQQQLGGFGKSLAQALGMPEELAGIQQVAGLQPNLLGPLLQQVLSQQGRGLQRPTLQFR
jgi:hypothetical protein